MKRFPHVPFACCDSRVCQMKREHSLKLQISPINTTLKILRPVMNNLLSAIEECHYEHISKIQSLTASEVSEYWTGPIFLR